MLVKYIRCGRVPVACIVSTGPGLVGWSVCPPSKMPKKSMMRNIAAGRAEKGTNAKFPNRRIWNPNIVMRDVIDLTVSDAVVNLSDVLNNEIGLMEKRAELYFKPIAIN